MDAFWSLLAGFGVALQPANLLFALIGCVIGTAVGVLPGIGPDRRHRDPFPADLQARPDRRHHHAVGDLLRRHVRRHHHQRPDERARRGRLRGRPPSTATDGEERARRRGPRHRRDRLLHRRHGGDHRARRRGAAARRGRPRIRAARILRASWSRARPGRRAFERRPPRRAHQRAPRTSRSRSPAPTSSRARPGFTFGSLDLLDGISFVPVIMGLYGVAEILANLDRPTAPSRRRRSADATRGRM